MRPGRTAILIVTIALVVAGLVALGWRITRQPSLYDLDPTDAAAR